MLKISRLTQRFAALLTLLTFSFVFVRAQQDDDAKSGTIPSPPALKAAMAGDDEDEDDSKITGATVRGRVVYQDTNRPARYVQIVLINDDKNSQNRSTKFLRTDENGEFVFRNVKAGTYQPHLRGEGFLTGDYTYRAAEIDKNTETDKDAESPQKITVAGTGEFQISVTAVRGGAIGGRVTYADGEAAAGVKVEVLRKSGSIFVYTSTYTENLYTDDRGAYRIAGLPAGQYVVQVTEPASHAPQKPRESYQMNDNEESLLKTFYSGSETGTKVKEIEVALGQEFSSIDISLPDRKLFTLAGKIVDKKSGRPLENYCVNFYKITDPDDPLFGSPISTFSAGKSGEWELKSLTQGKYRITVLQDYDYLARSGKMAKTPEYPETLKDIEIVDRNLDLVFEVPPPAVINGTVVMAGGGKLPESITIQAFDFATRQTSLSTFDDSDESAGNGRSKSFRIGRIAAGKYRLSVQDKDYYIKSVSVGGRDVAKESIEIEEGEILSDVRVTLANDFGTIKGKVNNYEPDSQAAVIAVTADAKFDDVGTESFSASVKRNGEFELKAMPGDYSVFVFTMKHRPKTRAEVLELFNNLTRGGRKTSVKLNAITTITLDFPK